MTEENPDLLNKVVIPWAKEQVLEGNRMVAKCLATYTALVEDVKERVRVFNTDGNSGVSVRGTPQHDVILKKLVPHLMNSRLFRVVSLIVSIFVYAGRVV